MKNDLRITGISGETWSVSREVIGALPAMTRVPDVSKIDPKRQGAGVYLSALIPEDELEGAKFVTVTAEGGKFNASLPINEVLDRALILFELGRGPLPAENGGPFRFWVPNAAACNTAEIDHCANVKGLEAITVTKEKGPDSRKKKYEERGC